MNEHEFRAVQIRALKAVEDPSFSDTIRRIQRWYSNQYGIPLTEIDKIPDQEILQAWFEERFLAMKNSSDEKIREDFKVLKESILFPREMEDSNNEDDDWEQKMLEELKQEKGLNGPDRDPNLEGIPDSSYVSGEEYEYLPED